MKRLAVTSLFFLSLLAPILLGVSLIPDWYEARTDRGNLYLIRAALFGLDDSAFHEVPVAFKEVGGALAYFPDMVNHLVLGPVSIVPRPYGPSGNGADPLEEAFKVAAGPTRDVRFVDDWILYHEASGEVHCGTNVRRRASDATPWWNTRPATAYDASFPK